MDNLNYIFFEEFKRLDKLCGDLYRDQHGITHYIDEMKGTLKNNYQYIPNWNSNLKELIRLRHIRNHLAHTEGAFNEEICTQEDIDWIHNFYQSILNQTDPIAVLNQNSKVEKQKSEQFSMDNETIGEINHQESIKIKTSDLIMIFITVSIIIFLIIMIVGIAVFYASMI